MLFVCPMHQVPLLERLPPSFATGLLRKCDLPALCQRIPWYLWMLAQAPALAEAGGNVCGWTGNRAEASLSLSGSSWGYFVQPNLSGSLNGTHPAGRLQDAPTPSPWTLSKRITSKDHWALGFCRQHVTCVKVDLSYTVYRHLPCLQKKKKLLIP